MKCCAVVNPLSVKILKLIAVSLIFLVTSCSQGYVSDSRIALGTLVTVTIPEKDEEMMDEIFSYIYEIENDISSHIPSSWVGKINSNAGIAPEIVPEDVYTLIKDSVSMAYYTDGIFNPAIGPLSSLWAMGTEEARVPEEEEITSVLPLLDYTNVILDDEENSVYLSQPGMALDLGGVGKGYASDCIAARLSDLGIESAIINLGGNILAYGSREGGSSWRIGIRNPFGDSSSVFKTVEVSDETVITSGVYQRYVEKDGIRYHHILNSDTGYPFQTDVVSATIINKNGELGDMLSTTLLAVGSEKALEIAEDLGVRVVLVLEDGSVLDSDGPESQIAVVEE